MVALPASSFHSLRKTSFLFSQMLGQIKYTKITLETEQESLASNLAFEQHRQPFLVSQVQGNWWNPGRVSSAGTAGSSCKQGCRKDTALHRTLHATLQLLFPSETNCQSSLKVLLPAHLQSEKIPVILKM